MCKQPQDKKVKKKKGLSEFVEKNQCKQSTSSDQSSSQTKSREYRSTIQKGFSTNFERLPTLKCYKKLKGIYSKRDDYQEGVKQAQN